MAKKSSDNASGRLFIDPSGQRQLLDKSLQEQLEDEAATSVECLGDTFPNEAARRKHYVELLRKKLADPEFRQIDGFPVGDDEAILEGSDPPWHTLCPNPFLPDIIRYIRDSAATDKAEGYSRPPFASDVTEGKNDPIYDAHPYHTKVPPKALMRLLLHYTNPGDIVLDAFCGSGMLGVAASLCQDPARHSGTFTGTKGIRHSILSDISPLATSIANVNSRPGVTAEHFVECADAVVGDAYAQYSWMYKTRHSHGRGQSVDGEILYCIWSEFYECSNCNKDIRAWDAIVDRRGSQLRKTFNCPFCKAALTKDSLTRVTESYYDSLLSRPSKRNKCGLVWIHYKVGTKRFEKAPDADDLALLNQIESTPYPPGTSAVKMNFRDAPWGGFYRAGYHAGVTHVHHFFTKRNLVALCALRDASVQSSLPRQMLFVLTGFLDNHSSKRNRYLIDRHHESGTTCGPLPNSLYIPELQCEVNPFNTWRKTVKKQTASFAISRPPTSMTTTEASELSQVPDCSVDYVFVDPPFGENIYYSESSFCWEYFIGVFTNSSREAIVSKYQHKTIDEYRRLIGEVFSECYRVVKPGRWMTVEFSNRSNAVWNALSEAMQAAGFVIADVRVFDKKHGTIRQDMGQSIKKDLIISAYRANGGLEDRFKSEAGTDEGAWDFVRTHLRRLPVFVADADGRAELIAERFAHYLFDRMVAFHVQRGISVPLSSPEFIAQLASKFPERDGMYFLHHQVAEYDKKRGTAKELLQLEMFVVDEKSAIQWLKLHLGSKPQTFQELHPIFMREIGGWQKHEQSLELSDLLNQNFLCYEGKTEVPNQIHGYLSSNYKELRNLGKKDATLQTKAKDRWYVPDPNKAGDLEKLRERTLLAEFDEYKSSKQRSLKVFRTEAVRAGFKAAYDLQNYKTIVEVAKKLPENVLQEDDKLLMYYDVATMRLGDGDKGTLSQ